MTRTPFPTAATAQGIKPERPAKPFRTAGLSKAYSRSLPVIGAAQGAIDAARRDSIKRGGI